MSSELIEIAELVTSWSNSDEQVEAVVTSDRETEVRAYEGEIESLTVAVSQGIGAVSYTHLTLPTILLV